MVTFVHYLQRVSLESYRGQHTAPDESSGAPLHNVESFMRDFYKHPQHYYTSNSELDREATQVVISAKGNPKAEVTVYRSVPLSVRTANSNDWVTLTEGYAMNHGESRLDGSYNVLSWKTTADTLYTDGNSVHEWGYVGNTIETPTVKTVKRVKRRH